MTGTHPRTGARVSSGAVTPAFPPVPLERLASVVPGASLLRGGDDALITDVAFDHRSVTPGSLFFAVPGERADGHEYAAEAVAAGAVAVVVERWLDLGAPQVRVASVREAMGPMSSMAFGNPSSSMATVGITGTNGKTTVTYVLESIFEAARWRSGVIGTTGGRLDGEPLPLSHTTPEAPDLQRVLALMRDRDVRAVAMEASSHALAQHRTDGVVFDVAVFTNLSQDHLDYHASMEAYFAAKARLFTPAHALYGAVNVDDPVGRRLREAEIPITTYAVDNAADLRASDVGVTADGLSFVLGGVAFRSALRGAFNVANIAGAVVAARHLGVPDRAIVDGVAALRAVPGRMEPVDAGQDFLVVVDYAHTPDSIRSVLRAARPLTSGRLILVFGCGGDRDRLKRPAMAVAATQGADLTVFTTDNPRSEDPLAILAEVQRGAVDSGGEHVVEPDRRSAIRAALHEARAGDVVVIAGKGHETVQEFSDRTIPFDDRTVAREELVTLGSSA